MFDLAGGANAFEAEAGGGIQGKVVLRLAILWKGKPNAVEVFNGTEQIIEPHRTST